MLKAMDKRMNTVNELLQNIRFLKFYGWGEKITQLRTSFILTSLQRTIGHQGRRLPVMMSSVGESDLTFWKQS